MFTRGEIRSLDGILLRSPSASSLFNSPTSLVGRPRSTHVQGFVYGPTSEVGSQTSVGRKSGLREWDERGF